MLTHRQRAKRRTLIWQASAVALVAGAGAMAAVPQVRAWLAPGAAAPRKIDSAAGGPAPAAPQQQLSIAAAAEALKVLTSWTPPPPPPPVQPEAAPVAEAAPPPPPTEWTYIGSIITPTLRSALIKVDNAQQIVRVGTSHNDVKLMVVEPNFIEIEKSGARERIELTSRTLLAPMEQPKRPVAFRPTPAPPPVGGQPGAAAMAMGRPANVQPPGPGTFDQARMAALAQREAAIRTATTAVNPPNRDEPIAQDDTMSREIAIKHLGSDNTKIDERMKMLRSLGFGPGMTAEYGQELLKKNGIDPGGQNREALEAMSKLMEEKESK